MPAATLALALVLLVTLLAVPAASAAGLDEAELDRRIDAARKGDFVVTLADDNGRPLVAADGPVRYRLRRHAFEFGTAIGGELLGIVDFDDGVPQPLPPEADRRRYEEIITRYFNSVVAENEMKWYAMEDSRGELKHDRAMHVYDWARDRGLYVRGHAVFWGVRRWQPDWMKQIPPAELEGRMKRRLQHVLGLFDGKIDEWDLNNEMMHEDFFAEALGLESGATYFQWAKAVAPDVRFYVNEYGVLQGDEVDRYVAHIRALLAAGAAVGGIGDQAHFHGPVPPNEQVWEILDKLGQFGLPVKVTEFDLHYQGMTEEAQAADTRRFYKLAFAHPAVEGIYMWGFYDGQHWRDGAGLWRKDWSIKPAGQAYVDLVTKEWHTEGTADLVDGTLRFRGFFGDYAFEHGGRTYRATLTRDNPSATATPVS